MSALFGPQTANAVTTKPTDTGVQRYGSVQTWFKNCSGPGASDGTVPDAAFYNRIVGALDYICGASGVSGLAGDDSLLYRAILQMVSQDAPDALNSLRELADAIQDDPNFAGTVMSMLANRLRFDQSQFLNTAQKAQALANLGLALAAVASSGAYADLSGKPTLGTAAALNVGTGANQVVQLDGSGKLPAVDGSQVTGINATIASGQSFLGADVALTASSTWFDALSVTLGSGTFLVWGSATVKDTAGASGFIARLFDGTNTYDAKYTYTIAAGTRTVITVRAKIINPAGPVKLQVQNVAGATGKVTFNDTSLSKDTDITYQKIG